MKTIGLLGGMSWESTVPYYRHVNEAVKRHLGGLHSAKIVLYSVDFHEIEELQRERRWQEAGQLLAAAARAIESAGAECIVLCTNTMHIVAFEIQQAVRIPLLHIADATGEAINSCNLQRIGLLGTRFTMEEDFYAGRLREKYGLQILTPEVADRAELHRVIYEELCVGKILESSRNAFRRIVQRLVTRGAEGVILGCTEISLLLDPASLPVPAFDTTKLHALYAAGYAVTEA